ncbi:MAG: NAD-dependent succinate-semialdehyde dehydrogenase [Deltaproteobacteria bacterium]|nr:MAG: NAD-dependent succinate-semialdehyde dehydrogenase [Deltaproteobacteria bacterium]
MTIATTNPATGETLKTFQPHSDQHLEQALDRAAKAFQTWRRTTFAERAARMQKAAALLEERKDSLARLITLEMGKLRKQGVAEIEKCANGCRYYAENAERHLADEVIATDAKRSLVKHQPVGAVLAVMPWNFPFWQVFRFAAPALMAGDVGLLKHASSVPQCALAIEEIFKNAGFPQGVFQTLLIGSDKVQKLIEDPRIVAATLTGSDGAGRSLGRAAGGQIKKTVLELGGSDPFVVLPSAKLEQAVKVAVAARIQNAGQSCIAAKRFIVHQQIAEEFEKRFVDAFKALKVGDPQDDATDVGPLASRQVLDDVDDQVRRSASKGARTACGGKRLEDRPGFFYAPTVLLNAENTAAFQEEVFGPVAAVTRAKDLDHAIALANDTQFGLGAAAFTNDSKEQERLADELEAGSVFINGMVKSDPRLPFGGIKASGYGRELSQVGIREFTNTKTVWIG